VRQDGAAKALFVASVLRSSNAPPVNPRPCMFGRLPLARPAAFIPVGGLERNPHYTRDHISTSAELVQCGRITICIRAWQAAMKVKGNSRPITSPLAKREWHCRGPGRIGMEPSFHALINFLH
jgi:hypothetical protein